MNTWAVEDCSLAGVDGARGGWMVAILDASGLRVRLVPDFQSVCAMTELCDVVAIDIPIGLSDVAQRGGRSCDRMARKILGRRASTVFSPPPRVVLECDSYAEALEICRRTSPESIGMSVQAFNILPKIREVDRGLSEIEEHEARFFEAHPELAFAEMNGGIPLDSKHERHGVERRRELLRLAGICSSIHDSARGNASIQDTLDALVLLRTAHRIHQGQAVILTGEPTHDQRAVPMRIAY